MDLNALNTIKEELDKLDFSEYSLNIQFKDKTNFTLSKTNKEEKKPMGFNKD